MIMMFVVIILIVSSVIIAYLQQFSVHLVFLFRK